MYVFHFSEHNQKLNFEFVKVDEFARINQPFGLMLNLMVLSLIRIYCSMAKDK